MKKWFDKSEGENGPEDGFSIEDETQQGSTPHNGEKSAKSKKWMSINKKKPWSLKKKIIVTVVTVLGAALFIVGIYFLPILFDPMGGFKSVGELITPPPSASPTPQISDGQVVPTPTPTLDPYAVMMSQGSFDKLTDIVNILLIGVDHAEERDTEEWASHGGKQAYHADVMIVLAVNTKTNTVDMISLPRDTYADIPGVNGIYKLNASIDCGGSWPSDAGFQKVCESASWMLGGIPIPYYYAVDMNAVVQLVDAIGGVDYNCDISFKMGGGKRKYEIGQQHMGGQAVLDYLRVRKDEDILSPSGQTGDSHRVERQKNMLVAIFNKLKDTGVIFKLPDILGAFNGNLYTNVELRDTIGFAAYAYKIDSANIKMHSMAGSSKNIFNWNFVITNQAKRVELLREIYGDEMIKVFNIHQYGHYSMGAAVALWEAMRAEVITKQSRPILDQVKGILDADAALPPYPTPTPVDPTIPVDPTLPAPTPVPSDGYRKYLPESEAWTIYNRAESEYSQMASWNHDDESAGPALKALNDQLTLDAQTLYLMFIGNKSVSEWGKYWHVDYGDRLSDSAVNQSYVHNEKLVDFD